MAKMMLLGSTQVCERLGIHRATLGQWMTKGWIVPAQQLPGGYLFTPEEVSRAEDRRRARQNGRILRAAS